MLYLYPLFQFGTVSLTHYNLWVNTVRKDGYALDHQRSGAGFGFGIGFRLSLFEVGVEPELFYTSSAGGDSEPIAGTDTYSYRRHTLINFIFAIPFGVSYPLTESFRFYGGARFLLGFSNLSVYDSLHITALGVHSWSVKDASMSSSSAGMGVYLGGDFAISDALTFFARVGYEVLSFSGYEGEYETRDSDDKSEKGAAYWVFNSKHNSIYVKDEPPKNNENDEIYAKEDLDGLRISLGLKFFVGR